MALTSLTRVASAQKTKQYIINFHHDMSPRVTSPFQHVRRVNQLKHRHLTINGAVNAPIASQPNTILNLNIHFESFYRVILVYNNWTNDRDVARILKRVIPIVGTMNNAIQIVKSSKSYGKAIIVTVIKKEAEQYVKSLRQNNLEAELEEA